MTIEFKAKIADLFNLVVAKGASFLLTVIVFSVIARGLGRGQFVNFGFWWSNAIMVGGVLFGGLASGLIRILSVRGTLVHLGPVAIRSSVLFGCGLLVLAAGGLLWPAFRPFILLLGAVAVFGAIFQIQTCVLTLLRARMATRANAIASGVIVLVGPLLVLLLLGGSRNLTWVFLVLSLAFAIATGLALVLSREVFAGMVRPNPEVPRPDPLFLPSVVSFTAVNVFSYVSLGIDFNLFKWLRPAAEFEIMGGGKIFFERFTLPALLVVAGAFSITVLRHNAVAATEGQGVPKVPFRPKPLQVLGLGLICLASSAGYHVFERFIRHEVNLLPLAATLCLSAAYVVYALNAILFDVLAIRRGFRRVVIHVLGFLLLGLVGQFLAIRTFGLWGWVGCWLLYNLTIFGILLYENVELQSGKALDGLEAPRAKGEC